MKTDLIICSFWSESSYKETLMSSCIIYVLSTGKSLLASAPKLFKFILCFHCRKMPTSAPWRPLYRNSCRTNQSEVSYHPPAYPVGAKEGRAHTMGLRQKQSNQPVFGQFLSNFIIQHPVAPQWHEMLHTPVLSDHESGGNNIRDLENECIK